MGNELPFKDEFRIEKLTIQANLFTVTFVKTSTLHKRVNNFYKWVQKHEGFISISESTREITLIAELGFLERMPEYIKEKLYWERCSV